MHRAFDVLGATAEWRYGVLEVDSPDARDSSISDAAFLETLAATLAQAIGKARRMEELRESRAFAQGLLDASPDCVKVLDTEGLVVSMDSRGIEVNDFASFADVRGRDFAALWPVEGREAIRAAMRRAAGGPCPTWKASAPRRRAGRNGGRCAPPLCRVPPARPHGSSAYRAT